MSATESARQPRSAALAPTPRAQIGQVTVLEPWVDKKELAHLLDCSVSWIEKRMAERMPHAIIAGRVKFKVSQVEPWLFRRGLMEQRGEVA